MVEQREINIYNPAVDAAQIASLEAGGHLMEIRNAAVMNPNDTLDGKFYADDITLQSENIILEILKSRYPHDTITSDRKVILQGDNNHTKWVVDPIDGTIPFIRHFPDWGVSICRLEYEVPQISVLYLPEANKMYTAIKGHGAFLNGQEIKVNQDKLASSVVAFDFGVKSNTPKVLKLIEALRPEVRQLISQACSSTQMASIADGGLSAFIHNAYPQDLLAGSLLVQEAGGKVTHKDGRPITPDDLNKDFIDWIASNGVVHQQIIDLINK